VSPALQLWVARDRALCHVVVSVSEEYAAVVFRAEVNTVAMREATVRHVSKKVNVPCVPTV
jgi:hypothetical protein